MSTIAITRLFHIQCLSPPKGLKVGGLLVTLLFSFLVSTGEVGAETLTVKGTGNDTYCVNDSTGKQMNCMPTNREIELSPGTYSVSLHGAKQTATVQVGQKTTLTAGLATLKGTGNDTYCVYDSTGQQMNCLSTNREIELFPGTYSVSLHGAKQAVTVQAAQKATLVAGLATVKGTGNDTYCVYDSTGQQMNCLSTNREIELLPGTYSVSLHGAKQGATVQAEQKTTLVAGLATVKGTGNDTYCVYDSTGQQMNCLSTNREIELLPGTYSVSLHGAKQGATVQAEQKTTLVAGLATVKGTGNDTYCVYDSTGQQMNCLSTNREIELFPGTYNFSLHGAKQTATVEAEQKTVLTAGILKIPGNGEDTYCVYDSTGQQMNCLSTGREIELFAGTYTVKLNDTTQTVVVQADAPSIPVVTQPPVDPSDATSTPVVTHPPLGPSQATDTTGKPVTTTTVMEGGNSVNGKPPEKQVKQKLSDTVDVKGNITVDPADVGQFVDILVYAAATFPGSDTVMYFMLGPGLTISAWDQNPASLVAFTNATLGSVQTVPMYSGTFFYPGTLKVFFGYRLANGTLVKNTQPIDITIDDDSAIAVNDSCTYDFEAIDRLSFSEQTQYGKTMVNTQPGCQWEASSNSDWITIVSGSSGNGTGTVTYAVAPNLGSDLKTGTITIAGKTVTITVPTRPISDASCSYEVSPISLSLPSTGKAGSINVITQPGCDWAASSNVDWIELDSITTNHENGTGIVVYVADPNSTASPKTGVMTVAGKTVTVTVAATETGTNDTNTNDPILVSQVTNPDTELGFIGTTGKETIGIFGTKDSQGRLVSINKISFGSQTDESQNLVITLGKDYLPTTMEFPDGSKVEYSNYTSEGATATYRSSDGSVANQAFVPMPFDDIQKGAEAIKQYAESPQPTEENPVPSTPDNTSSPTDSNCKEVMGAFCKQVDNLIWGVSQLLSVVSCAAAGVETVLTGGLALPFAVLACGSVVLNGISRMEDVIKGNTGTCGDKDKGTCGSNKDGGTCIKKLKKANDLLQKVVACSIPPNLGKCASTFAEDIRDEVISKVAEALFNPDEVCQAEPCDALEKLCDKYKGLLVGRPVMCLCSVGLSLSHEEGEIFVNECKAIGGKPKGIVQCSM